jgi:hypothetical protein
MDTHKREREVVQSSSNEGERERLLLESASESRSLTRQNRSSNEEYFTMETSDGQRQQARLLSGAARATFNLTL